MSITQYKVKFSYVDKKLTEYVQRIEHFMLNNETSTLSEEINKLKKQHEKKALTAITAQVVRIEDRTDTIH